eukprot:6200085-Pleurochrysis_carterae.AAC.1
MDVATRRDASVMPCDPSSPVRTCAMCVRGRAKWPRRSVMLERRHDGFSARTAFLKDQSWLSRSLADHQAKRDGAPDLIGASMVKSTKDTIFDFFGSRAARPAFSIEAVFYGFDQQPVCKPILLPFLPTRACCCFTLIAPHLISEF